MKTEKDRSDVTFVLFGKEAILQYNISIEKLLQSMSNIECNIGTYTSVKKFVQDSKKLGDFTEITEKEYLQLKKAGAKDMRSFKSNIFSKFFKT